MLNGKRTVGGGLHEEWFSAKYIVSIFRMTAAPPDLREGLIQSAVKFLSDPKVQESPLNKRLAFLESKGLTQNEIDEALRRVHKQKSAEFNALPADTTATSVADTTTSFAPSLSWKDYTINVLLAGGFGYGLFRLLQVR